MLHKRQDALFYLISTVDMRERETILFKLENRDLSDLLFTSLLKLSELGDLIQEQILTHQVWSRA